MSAVIGFLVLDALIAFILWDRAITDAENQCINPTLIEWIEEQGGY